MKHNGNDVLASKAVACATVFTISGFTFSAVAFSGTLSPVSAQGISEYGGVMSMPKLIPNPQGAAGAVGSLYNIPAKTAGAISGAGSSQKSPPAGRSATSSAGSTKKGGIPPKGTVIRSGDIPGGTANVTRQAMAEYSRQAKDLYNKAVDAQSKGKTDEAEQMYRKSLLIRESYWRGTDKQIPEIQLKLGEIYIAKGDLKKAEGSLSQVLVSLSHFFGPGSDNRLTPLLLLADVYEKEGDSARSYDSLRQAYMLSKRVKESPVSPIDIMLKTGKLAINLKKFREAEQLYEVALSDDERGKLSHDQLLTAIDDYALALKGLSRDRDADFVLSQGIKIRESSGKGSETPQGSSVPSSGSTSGGTTANEGAKPADALPKTVAPFVKP